MGYPPSKFAAMPHFSQTAIPLFSTEFDFLNRIQETTQKSSLQW